MNKEIDSKEKNHCYICLDNDKTNLYECICSLNFHTYCLMEWKFSSHNINKKLRCPQCNKDYEFKNSISYEFKIVYKYINFINNYTEYCINYIISNLYFVNKKICNTNIYVKNFMYFVFPILLILTICLYLIVCYCGINYITLVGTINNEIEENDKKIKASIYILLFWLGYTFNKYNTFDKINIYYLLSLPDNNNGYKTVFNIIYILAFIQVLGFKFIISYTSLIPYYLCLCDNLFHLIYIYSYNKTSKYLSKKYKKENTIIYINKKYPYTFEGLMYFTNYIFILEIIVYPVASLIINLYFETTYGSLLTYFVLKLINKSMAFYVDYIELMNIYSSEINKFKKD